MKIAMAQVNTTVGDLAGNLERIKAAVRSAESQQADLVVLPELALTGYPPEDLLLKPSFIRDNVAALRRLAREIRATPAVVGFVDWHQGRRYNAAAWLERGTVKAVYHKICLPNYGVFDEARYFAPGGAPLVRSVAGVAVGVTICEDIWVPDPGVTALRAKKPDVVVNLSSSPFHAGKLGLRHHVAQRAAALVKAPMFYCNTVGGQDELVFDGGSFVALPRSRVPAQAPQFEEGVFVTEIRPSRPLRIVPGWTKPPVLSRIEEIFRALVLGTRDYVEKNRFGNVAIGLSGGIDSTLVATIAVEALGKDRVIGVTMPSRFNSSETRADAALIAKNLGIRFLEIPIQPIFGAFAESLTNAFANAKPDVTEENVQARIRGTLLMALSNKFGWLVLTTGNKSEMSTGFCTLYGDTAGGFAVLKDVVKTDVYRLANFINERNKNDLIPLSVITRTPTAELREKQADEQVLGPYGELDPVITAYIEGNRSYRDLSKKNPAKAAYYRKIIGMIDRSEYKRRQAPPGIKITPRSFGRDHRMPITNRYNPS